ncbi:MAG: phosphoribosyl-ATP diphosphatase [Deltaproteobacteria bacterium]|nr:MAG: phosphoribosyl-ATP diphosphatase [Deltaproteobacteria bacterium]
MSDIIARVEGVIRERKEASAESSYVASLFAKGEDKILSKVGEEAVEVILASKEGDEVHLVKEVADLLFHTLVLLGHKEIPFEMVEAELEARFGVSGIVEKNSRKG